MFKFLQKSNVLQKFIFCMKSNHVVWNKFEYYFNRVSRLGGIDALECKEGKLNNSGTVPLVLKLAQGLGFGEKVEEEIGTTLGQVKLVLWLEKQLDVVNKR
jgi:hypothetical protein